MTVLEKSIVKERRVKLFFFLGSLFLVLAALALVKNLLISFLLAFVIYYLLAPAVNLFERRGLSRAWATAVPFLFVTLTLVILVQNFFPDLVTQVDGLKVELPRYMETAVQALGRIESKTASLLEGIYPINIQGQIAPKALDFAKSVLEKSPEYISQSLTIFFLTPFLAFFMLVDGRDFVRKILNLVPNHYFELALHLNYQIGAQMGGFIRARLLECTLVGLVVWVGLLILNFPYALVLGIFAGLVVIIPYIGPFLGLAPILLIHLSNGGSNSELLGLLLVYGIAQLIDIALIVPFIVAKIVNLHPVTVVLAVIVGSQTMGVLGMIICIPIFSTLKVTVQAIYKHLTDFRA